MKESQVATIDLDGIEGRGIIHVNQQPATYHEDLVESDGLEWVITVELPDGTIADPAIAPQRELRDALEAIRQSWQLECWDLRFTRGQYRERDYDPQEEVDLDLASEELF